MTLGDPSVQSRRFASFLALERNVVAVAGAMFLLSFGEELWKRFMPKYLEALGAPVLAIGLYGTVRDTLDGLYQYPGGWIADHYGRRRALWLFVALAGVGYVVYWLAPSWPFVFAGLVFVMAWSSMASPALFAVVGDALPREQRAMGFTVQSIMRRVPIVIAPTLGGLAIAALGVREGVRAGLVVTLALAAATLAVVARIDIPVSVQHGSTNIAGIWRVLPDSLKRLLASDIFIRISEGLVDVFLVIYATNVVGITAAQFGFLVGIQMATSILVYIPAARIADRASRKPLVIATFIAFSLFPVAVMAARSFAGLILAFVVGGLREIGEPARKALIVDLAQPHLRARSVGLYYLVRSIAIAPAGFIGGILWTVTPALPFHVAATAGLVGTALFTFRVHERQN